MSITFRLSAFSGLFSIFFACHLHSEVSFNQDIRPILSDSCFHCHGFDENDRKGDLRLDDEKAAKQDMGGYAAIVPEKPEESEIIYRITTDDQDELMPPPDKGHKITPEQLTLLKTWIKEGAKYEKHWSFTKIKKPEVQSKLPAIDHFIQAKLKQKGLKPSPMASPNTQLRRVSLDLTGLPPSTNTLKLYRQDIEKLGQDKAYSKAVDRLLSSPRYGERMAWQWLEASRYADTDGYQNDGPRTMWRWRDWVINAYNKNMPFDQFTIQQLAGDLLPNPTHDQIIATAFNRNNRYNSEAGIPIDEFLLENAVDRVDTTSTIWMGLTMGCARCHDHKYDPISQKDYYQLIDYFNDIAESGRAVKYGNSEPWIKTPLKSHQDQLHLLDQHLAKLENQLKSFDTDIAKAQEAWETDALNISSKVNYGLDHFFNFDSINEKVKAIKGQKELKFVDGVIGKAIAVEKGRGVALGSIDGLIGNGRFSLSFWMNPKNVDQGVVLSNESNNTQRAGIFIEFVKGHLRWNINHRWISGVSTIETVQTIKPQQWVHVALSNDASQTAGGMKLYLNGKEQKVNVIRNTNSNKANRKKSSTMHLGYSKHGTAWQGYIDELSFYTNRTLSPREMMLLAQPKSIQQLVKIPHEQRQPTQRELLRLTYLEHSPIPQHKKLLHDINEAKSQRTAYSDKIPTTMITKDLPQGRPSFIRKRGIYDQYGEEVKAGVPASLPPLPKKTPNNRLAFSKWLVSSDHPLTARVTINRYWQLFFGRGLVKTPEDFGTQGDLPSHPKLLDWLAATFIEEQWDIKKTLKRIVMSHTYRQSSKVDPLQSQKDPNNIFLSHTPRLRLHGNLLRDQALYVSGLLVEQQGGPSVKPYQPAGLWKEASNFTYTMGKGDDLHRRSLYTYWKRTLAPPTMAVLDTADREYCSVKPKFTNTPLQALTLLNDFTFVEAARGFAENILDQGGRNDRQRITYAFIKLTTRQPNSDELATLLLAYQKYRKSFQASPKDAEKLVHLNQKNYKPKHNVIELASAMTLANVLLNLDEVTTRN